MSPVMRSSELANDAGYLTATVGVTADLVIGSLTLHYVNGLLVAFE